jgi:hypothetical protein
MDHHGPSWTRGSCRSPPTRAVPSIDESGPSHRPALAFGLNLERRKLKPQTRRTSELTTSSSNNYCGCFSWLKFALAFPSTVVPFDSGEAGALLDPPPSYHLKLSFASIAALCSRTLTAPVPLASNSRRLSTTHNAELSSQQDN